MSTEITLNTIAEEDINLSSNLSKVLPTFSYSKEKILSMLANNTPVSSTDYDDIIPKGNNVYLTCAYTPEDSVRISKEDYKRIVELPFDYRDNPNVDNPYDVELQQEHYEIAQRIEKFSINIAEEELLKYTRVKDRVARILEFINEYEKNH